MSDDVSDRIEELEAEVAALRETVEQQQYTVRYLAADADLDPLDPSCPHCGEGEFVTESGISWKRVRCSSCGHSEYL